MILAPCLRDPAQLIGCYQLLEVMHTFPQHLALVRIFHEDAMIFSLQNVLLGQDIKFSRTAFSALSKG